MSAGILFEGILAADGPYQALHLLQKCLVYVNTLMLQRVLAEPAWLARMTAEDHRGLKPAIHAHINPYGEASGSRGSWAKRRPVRGKRHLRAAQSMGIPDILMLPTKELMHTALTASAGHGELFKAAALKLGLQGPVRSAMPGVLLRAKLAQIAEALGPLPHARLDIAQLPLTAIALDRPKKQQARMLKAECQGSGCGYGVRIRSKMGARSGTPPAPPGIAPIASPGEDLGASISPASRLSGTKHLARTARPLTYLQGPGLLLWPSTHPRAAPWL